MDKKDRKYYNSVSWYDGKPIGEDASKKDAQNKKAANEVPLRKNHTKDAPVNDGYEKKGGDGYSSGYYDDDYYDSDRVKERERQRKDFERREKERLEREQREGSAARPYDVGQRNSDMRQGARRDDGGGAPARRESKRQKKKKRKAPRIILAIVIIIALLVGGGYIWLGVTLSGSRDDGFSVASFNEGVSTNAYMQGKTCIALVGLDSRDGDLDQGNSDTMMIAMIDGSSHTIKLISVFRDTYLDVNVGNAEYNKANYAYASGGAAQMVNMLNGNFDLAIEDYITIDFKALAVAVDDIGGITVEMTDDEVLWMNDNGWETAEVLGGEWTWVEPGNGTYELNGMQAVSYARIRKTTGDDFKRTSRQRLVIGKITEKAKAQGPITWIRLVADIVPQIKTSLGENEFISLAWALMTYDVSETGGFPYAHLERDIGSLDCVVPVTLEYNVKWLHQWLFGDPDYRVSSTVSQISEHISDVSGYYSSSIDRAVSNGQSGSNPDSGSEADGN